MKKVLCLLTVLAMMLGCICISASAADYGIVLNNNVALVVGNTTAIANNALQTLSIAPTLVDGEVLIPISLVSDYLNGTVSYVPESGLIGISFGSEKNATMRVGSKSYTLNGRAYSLAVAPQIISDNVMVPLYAVAGNIIGKTVFYDAATQLIVISSRGVLKDSVTDAAVISAIATAIASRNLPEISVPTYYELDWDTVEETVSVGGGASAPTVKTAQIFPTTVTATQEPESENGAYNAFDGDTESRWACDGEGSIVADFGSVINIVKIEIYWWKTEERNAKYDLEISSDGSTYTTIFSDSNYGEHPDTFDINQSARYVRVNSYGNNNSNWNSLQECAVYVAASAASSASSGGGSATSQKSSSPTGDKVSINGSMVTASSEPESANPGKNIADGSSSTVWAAEGSANAVIDLGEVISVASVGVQMKAYDDGRSVNYGVSVSADGSSYTQVYDGACAAGGAVTEYISVGTEARYVKLSVNGSTTNSWASVAEVEVYSGTLAADDEYTAASFQNMSSVSGDFVLAPYGSTDVLYVTGDNFTLSVGAYSAGNSAQLWSQGSNSSGGTLISKSTGYCLDVANQSYDEGGQICVWEGNDGNNQSWTLELDGDAYYIQSVMSGYYLSYNGGSVQQVGRDNATRWVVADPSTYTPAAGTQSTVKSNVPTPITEPISGNFRIISYGTNKALTSNDETFAVTVSRSKLTENQTWTMEAAEGGFVIKSALDGTVLEIPSQATEAGKRVVTAEADGSAGQTWIIEELNGHYYIKNAMSGLYLTVEDTFVRQRDYATMWSIKSND